MRPNDLLKALRPHQWSKSVFVLVGLVFGHGWHDAFLVRRALMATIAFTLLASGVYVFNDLIDREADRIHPTKRHRPIASGAITTPVASIVLAVLVAAGLAIGWQVSLAVVGFLLAYLILNVAYSCSLKHVVLVDVFVLASGFVLRVLVGTVGIGIAPSHWLLLCSLMLALLLSMSKRRAELAAEAAVAHRQVLGEYSQGLLDQLITVTAAGAILSYSLYTVSAETIRLHGTDWLVATVPLVMLAIFRWLLLGYHGKLSGDVARDVLRDRQLLACILAWILLTVLLISHVGGRSV